MTEISVYVITQSIWGNVIFVNLLVSVSHLPKMSSQRSCIFRWRPYEWRVTSETSENMLLKKAEMSIRVNARTSWRTMKSWKQEKNKTLSTRLYCFTKKCQKFWNELFWAMQELSSFYVGSLVIFMGKYVR